MKRLPTSSVASLISTHIAKLKPRQSQRQLALKMGFASANMLSMVKTGAARLPLERTASAAEVLGIDPALLFRLQLLEYWPGFEKVVEQIFGGIVTDNERQWLEVLQDVFGPEVPSVPKDTRTVVKALKTAIKEAGV